MIKLLKKEMKLSASPLSYLFIIFALIAFCPGYPILVASFFLCLGIFQSFQFAREANDITYTLLLPVPKKDVVHSKYVFCIFIEGCYFALTAAVTLVRMTLLSDAPAYKSNALMSANLTYLGFVLIIFGLFNLIFVGGFFKTAYYFAKPFVAFIVVSFVTVGCAETLHHIPGLESTGALGFDPLLPQLAILAAGAAVYLLLTLLSMRGAVKNFEKTDL